MEILYTKYSDNTIPEFATITQIIKDNERKYTVKRPQTPIAQPHIDSLPKNRELLCSVYGDAVEVCPVTLKDGAAYFENIEGESLDSAIVSAIKSGDLTRISEIFDMLILLVKGVNNNAVSFEYNKEFWNTFGDIEIPEETLALSVANMDIVPSNIILKKDKPVLINYERVTNFLIPVDFVLYWTFNNIYTLYKDGLSSLFSFEELYEKLGISLDVDILKSLKQKYRNCLLDNNVDIFNIKIFNLYKKSVIKTWDSGISNSLKYYSDINKFNHENSIAVINKDVEIMKLQKELYTASNTKSLIESRLNAVLNSRTWRVANQLKNIYKTIKFTFGNLFHSEKTGEVITGKKDIIWIDKNNNTKSDRLYFSLDKIYFRAGRLDIKGWLFADNTSINSVGIQIINKDYSINIKINYHVSRDDVAATFNKLNANKCGFKDSLLVPIEKLSKFYFILKNGEATASIYMGVITPD